MDPRTDKIECQEHSVAGRREPQVPLSSLTSRKLRDIAEQIKDPEARKKALDYVSERDRRERSKTKGKRRSQKAARRNNRRSR